MNDPGRLIHVTGGETEQGGWAAVHSLTSTVHAGSEPELVQPWSQIHVYLG